MSIEANEISVIEFDHLRKYIQFKVDDTANSIRDFGEFLTNSSTSQLVTGKKLEFGKWCERIRDELYEIGNYLFDYRIELMNHFLGDLFVAKVPRRKPRDPKYKVLTQVATKKAVEREAQMREERLGKYPMGSR